jgi:hypothetical protein
MIITVMVGHDVPADGLSLGIIGYVYRLAGTEPVVQEVEAP